MANSADPDQLASSEAKWSGSALFAKAEHRTKVKISQWETIWTDSESSKHTDKLWKQISV